MKRLNTLFWAVLTVLVFLALLACAPAQADEEDKPISEETTGHIIQPDWGAWMREYAANGYYTNGGYAEEMRNQQIEAGILDEPRISFSDLYLLSKIMEAEAGIEWPDWAVMLIGEVVLNRAASDRFDGDTVQEIIYAPGQYAPVWESGWDDVNPEPEYIEIAWRLLSGERALDNPDMVWQALYKQGTSTLVTYHDIVLGSTTYFCE